VTTAALTELEGGMTTCPDCEMSYPDLAGVCPYHSGIANTLTVVPQQLFTPLLPAWPLQNCHEYIVAIYQAGVVVDKDNGLAPRWYHKFGYDNRFIGVVNHIPWAVDQPQLDAYFNGGNAQGSTHLSTGRPVYKTIRLGDLLVPFSQINQYMPFDGCSPWAQGVIDNTGSCPIPLAPLVRTMRPGEPNGAFLSVENVDGRVTGSGVTDAQFNSIVFIRAWSASVYQFEINPTTQLWHAEIDRRNRCNDPGWSGELEDAMQLAARKLQRGDLSGLRGVQRVTKDDMNEQLIRAIVQDELKQFNDALYKDQKGYGWGRKLEHMLYTCGLVLTFRWKEAILKIEQMIAQSQ